MFMIHGLIIAMVGVNVGILPKGVPVLTFAFATRSSVATIPLTIRAQIEELNVPAPIANISVSFGDHWSERMQVSILRCWRLWLRRPWVWNSTSDYFQPVSRDCDHSFGIAGAGGGANAAWLCFLLSDFRSRCGTVDLD